MLHLRPLTLAALLLAPPLAGCATTGAESSAMMSSSAAIDAAIADPARPATDVARDAARKPGELLAFAGVKPGDKVADFIMGGGYLTRILARAVGPTGKVYAYQPAEFIQYRAAYGDEQDAVAKDYANLVPSRESLGAIAFPEPLDTIVTVQNWHDLHLKASPPGAAGAIARQVYAALKPGGTFVVVDHAAAAGTGVTMSDTLHRIDPAAARTEIEAAGFRFAGESAMYANPADPRTALVFDPTIQGRTDQFAYKFVKPKG